MLGTKDLGLGFRVYPLGIMLSQRSKVMQGFQRQEIQCPTQDELVAPHGDVK